MLVEHSRARRRRIDDGKRERMMMIVDAFACVVLYRDVPLHRAYVQMLTEKTKKKNGEEEKKKFAKHPLSKLCPLTESNRRPQTR